MSVLTTPIKSLWSYNPLPTGCVLYLPLWSQGLRGSAFKSIDPFGHTNTVFGATLGAEGRILDGNDYIDIGSTLQSTFRGSYTVAGWAKLDDGRPSTVNVIMGTLSQAGGLNDLVMLAVLADGKLQFDMWSDNNEANAITNDVILADSQAGWHLFMGVADSTVGGVGGLVIYFDGAVQALGANNGDTSGVTFADYTSLFNLFIGARNDEGTDNLQLSGVMGEQFVWGKALNTQEALYIYEKTKGRYL